MQGFQKESSAVLKWLFFSMIVMACLVGCNNATSTPPAEIPTTTMSTSAETRPTVTEPQALDEGEYEILGNMEIVEYCLPYPKKEFKEDYDLAEYKGQHVLVSKNKKSKIIFSGNPVDMALDALYDKCLADIAAMKGTTLSSQNKLADGFSLRWTVGDRVFFMKKWYRKEAEETVTAQFEYPAAEEAVFGVWITDIAGHRTACE